MVLEVNTKTLSISVTTKQTLDLMQTGISWLPHMVKKHVMVLVIQPKEVAKASLQRPLNDQIITPYMYKFCSQNIKGITYVFVKSKDVFDHSEALKAIFDSCQSIAGTRAFHCYVPISESTVWCYCTRGIISGLCSVKTCTLNKDRIACNCGDQWWIGEVDDVSMVNRDVHVFFYHPPWPTSFQKNNWHCLGSCQ